MFTVKKTTEMFFFQIKIWMSHPEKLTPPCYLANCRFLRIVHGTKLFRIKKQFLEKMTFIIGCLSHSEKATSSSFLANYWLLRIEKKMTFIIGCMKHSEKATSSSYLPNWFFLLSLWKDVWVIQKELHHHAISSNIDFWDLTM